MARWRTLQRELERETRRILASEPEEITRLFRAGILPYNAGAGGQYFGTIVFVNSDLRALGNLYLGAGIQRAIRDPEFTLEHCKKLLEYCNLREGMRFLAYCGFSKLWRFTRDLFAALDEIDDKQDLAKLAKAYFNYVWILYGWSHQRYPWGLGTGIYRKRSKAQLKELGDMYREASAK